MISRGSAAFGTRVACSVLRVPWIQFPAFGLGALLFQSCRDFASQAIQFADGQQYFSHENIFQLPKLERRASEAPQLLSQTFGAKRLLLRFGQRHRGIPACDVALFVASDQRERLAHEPVNFHLNRSLKFRRIAFKALTQVTIQFRIAGFPKFVSHVDTVEINITVAEAVFRGFCYVLRVACCVIWLLRASSFHFVNAATLFLLFWFAGIEHNAVAGFQWSREFHHHAIAQDSFDIAKKYAALFSKSRMDQLLVVDSAKPAGVQPARKRHFHFVFTIYDWRFTSFVLCGA